MKNNETPTCGYTVLYDALSNIKRFFKILGKVLLWIIYHRITAKERQAYVHAKFKDREVLNVSNDLFSTTFTMGQKLYGKEPERNFLKWKEFRNMHGF